MSEALLNGNATYKDRQAQRDREYAAAWENAPLDFRRKAAMRGLHLDIPEIEGMAMEYNDNYSSQAHVPNMADALDDYVDQVIEKFGVQHAGFIRAVYRELRKPMDEEVVRNRANLLARVAMFLVQDEKGNLRARVHALLHSIPRLPTQNGFPSMRASAKVCGVSPEWLRRKRDSWCDVLEIDRPANGTKSDEAKLKYRANALGNHWRKQIYKRNGKHEELRQQSAHAH